MSTDQPRGDDLLVERAALMERAATASLSHPDPGWSAQWGGPDGVARLASQAAMVLRARADELDALRAAAVARLTQDDSPAQVARDFGVSRPAIIKTARKGYAGWAAALAADEEGTSW